jgi:death on curing protein
MGRGRPGAFDRRRRAAVIAFYGRNGRRLTLTNDAAYDLVISVAAGHLDTVDAIAAILQTATRPRR